MKKSTSNILMIVGFLVVVIGASMMFVKKTEAFQTMAPMPSMRSAAAPMPSMRSAAPPMTSMRSVAGPMPSMLSAAAPMPSMRSVAAPMPSMRSVAAPMPSMRPPMPAVPSFPSLGAPTPMMGPTPRISDEVVNKQLMEIKRIDTSLLSMTRSFSDGIKFFKNLLNQRRTVEQSLVRVGRQPPNLPKEVYDFLLTMKL